MGRFISDDDEYKEYMNRKLSESVQYKPKEEPTTITLYADNKPYRVIDLKDIDDMSEEEYNDKLKDAWFKKTHYETVEELTMDKYYNYEVEEDKRPEETENNKSLCLTGEILAVASSLLFVGGLVGTLFWILGSLISGG